MKDMISRVALYDYHHSMVTDRVRVESFQRAIMNTVVPGDVVVDIGTGTGLLAMFAAVAGARRVYAIEREPVIDIARRVATANGVADRIEFIASRSTDVVLPELADVLITETIGNAAFDEGILAWVRDAKARLLKPDARIIPKRLALIGALLELPRDYCELEKLSSRLHTFDLSPLRDLAIGNMAWDDLSPVSVVTEPCPLIVIDLQDATDSVSGECVLTARRDATIHAVGAWFESEVAEGIFLTNTPPSPAPSWHQGVVTLEQPLDLKAGDDVRVAMDVSGDGTAWKHSIERLTSR